MDFVAQNVLRVREEIARAAALAGADPAEIALVAAGKTKGADFIRAAVAAGVDAVGENRTSELVEKHAQGAYAGTEAHFIGHLQRNKVRDVVGIADLIHSADSRELLQLLEKRAESLGICQRVLLQVNIGREAQKSGATPEAAEELAAFAGTLPHIRLEGLMAVPPPKIEGPGPKKYPYFEEMYQLFVDIRDKKYDNISMRTLSMGMSGDFVEAIRAGANMVRVGSAIFGSRDYTR